MNVILYLPKLSIRSIERRPGKYDVIVFKTNEDCFLNEMLNLFSISNQSHCEVNGQTDYSTRITLNCLYNFLSLKFRLERFRRVYLTFNASNEARFVFFNQ